MVEVSWLVSAKEDLKAIFEFIAQDSDKYAALEINRIQDKVALLSSQPYLGKILPELENQTIRELIEGKYRIIYRILDENHIHILMVHHSSRDLGKRLKLS